MMRVLLAVSSILAAGHVAAAQIRLEQIVSRENPAFQCERARLFAGRDERVYLASCATPSFVLRLDRDGRGKVGATVGYALTGVAANADGVLATSNAHFSHRVALYDRSFKEVVTVDDFLVNDQVGWDAPGHVEAGARDFFGLDQHRNRIVRLSAGGKVLQSYAIPHEPEGNLGLVQDFRVCEKRETFYLLARSGPLRCVGFDGRVRWSVNTEVSWGEGLNNGGFDVDEGGTLYTLGPRGEAVLALRPPMASRSDRSGCISTTSSPSCRTPVLRHARAGWRFARPSHARVRTLPPLRSDQQGLQADRRHGARATDGRVPDRHLDRGGFVAVPHSPGVDPHDIRTAMARLGSYGRSPRLPRNADTGRCHQGAGRLRRPVPGVRDPRRSSRSSGHPRRLSTEELGRDPSAGHRGIGYRDDAGQSHRLRPGRGGAVRGRRSDSKCRPFGVGHGPSGSGSANLGRGEVRGQDERPRRHGRAAAAVDRGAHARRLQADGRGTRPDGSVGAVVVRPGVGEDGVSHGAVRRLWPDLSAGRCLDRARSDVRSRRANGQARLQSGRRPTRRPQSIGRLERRSLAGRSRPDAETTQGRPSGRRAVQGVRSLRRSSRRCPPTARGGSSRWRS